MLCIPDDFAGDWYGWLTNQCGHVVIGLVPAGIAWFMSAPMLAAFLTIIGAYFLVVEVLLQRLQLPWDSFVDTWFVALGAAVGTGLAMGSGVAFFAASGAMVLSMYLGVRPRLPCPSV